VLALTLVTLQACKKPAALSNGLTPVKFQADWYPQPEQGGFYTALVKGYYKDAGLAVEIVPGGPYIVGEQAVATNAVQFAMGSSDKVIEATANGEALLAVGATMQHDPQGIMLHANSPVHTFSDLNGHSIAVRPASTWFEFIVKKFHLDKVREIPATYSVANFLQDPNYIQQVFVTSEPYYVQKANQPVRTMLISDAGYDPYRVFFTSADYARQHPDIVARFVQASLRGWQSYLEDPKPAHDMIKKLNPAIDPELMQFSYEGLRKGHFVDGNGAPGGGSLGQFDPERWKTMAQTLLDLKVITNPVDPTTVYTTQYLH
jgi:NitT/TauT family transport system substrate-binding protein